MSTSSDSDRAIGDAARALNSGVELHRLLDRLTPETRAAMAMLLLERGPSVTRSPEDEMHAMEGPHEDRRTVRQAVLADRLGLRRCGPKLNESLRDLQSGSQGPVAFPGLSLWGRQTGRTVRMLLDALVDLRDGHGVVILAPSVSIGIFCVNWLRAMLQELGERGDAWAHGVPTTRMGYVTSAKDLEIVLRVQPTTRIHVDHTWDEFMDERTRARALETIAGAKRSRWRFAPDYAQNGPWGVHQAAADAEAAPWTAE